MVIADSLLRRVVLFLLHLALIVTLWTTALAHASDRPTAIPLLTDVGASVINPAITPVGKGVDQARYQQLEQQAHADPTALLSVPGLKTSVRGSEIVGLSYEAAVKVIYGKSAEAYYTGGLNAAFDVPSLPTGFGDIFNGYGSLAGFAQSHGLPVSISTIPANLLNLLGFLGLSPNSLTETGHDSLSNISLIGVVVSLLLALVLLLISKRWGRISSVAWAVFNAALPGVVLLGLGIFVVSRNFAPLRGVNDILGLIGGAFMPTYVGAAVAGVLGLIVSFVLHLATRGRGPSKPVPAAYPPAPPLMPLQTPPYRPGGPAYPTAPADTKPVDPNADTAPF